MTTNKRSTLAEALVETAKAMRDADLLDAATYERIFLRHATQAPVAENPRDKSAQPSLP
jgi:hypothetical protein